MHSLTQFHMDCEVTCSIISDVLVLCMQGAWLLVLFNLSHAIEHNVTQRAQGSMATLDQGPQGAWRVPTNPDGSPASGAPQRIHSNDVRLGDLIYVRAGEQVGSSSST